MTRNFLPAALFLACIPFCSIGQDTIPDKYIKIYYTLNGDSLYPGKVINKKDIDTSSCLSIALDTNYVYDGKIDPFHNGFTAINITELESKMKVRLGADSIRILASDFCLRSYILVPDCILGSDYAFYHCDKSRIGIDNNGRCTFDLCFSQKEIHLLLQYCDITRPILIDGIQLYNNTYSFSWAAGYIKIMVSD